MMVLVYIWYDDKYRSKVFFTTIPTPSCDIKIKVRQTCSNFSKLKNFFKKSILTLTGKHDAVSWSDMAQLCVRLVDHEVKVSITYISQSSDFVLYLEIYFFSRVQDILKLSVVIVK